VITVDCNTLRITRINEKSHFSHLIHAVAMKSRLRMVYDHLRDKATWLLRHESISGRPERNKKALHTCRFMAT
ncbi:hypothetical protein, partial [Salmonella sp. L44]